MSVESWLRIYPDRQTAGRAAARDVAVELRRTLDVRGSARMIFAAAPSQSEMLDALITEPDIDWSRVTAFHMDEYLGLGADAPERFGNWLRRSFFDRVQLAAVHILDPSEDPEGAVRRYTALLAEAPIDIVCLGIGVNGHLAFNDPPVADFADPEAVKVVALDDVCRQQQVDDGCFASLAEVPTSAITLTIPTLLSTDRLYCVAPGSAKANAARATVQGPIGTECPSTILRTHPGCTLYLDFESAADLRPALVS